MQRMAKRFDWRLGLLYASLIGGGMLVSWWAALSIGDTPIWRLIGAPAAAWGGIAAVFWIMKRPMARERILGMIPPIVIILIVGAIVASIVLVICVLTFGIRLSGH